MLGPQLYVGAEQPKVKPLVKGGLWCKPFGGLWTSTYDEKTGSDWVRWCLCQNFEIPNKEWLWNSYIIIPKKDAKILIIDNYEDCEDLYSKYGNVMYPGSYIQAIDFLKIAEKYDAVHLTRNGQWETRYTMQYNFYGWDCESTVWFRDVFEEITYIGPKYYGQREEE